MAFQTGPGADRVSARYLSKEPCYDQLLRYSAANSRISSKSFRSWAVFVSFSISASDLPSAVSSARPCMASGSTVSYIPITQLRISSGVRSNRSATIGHARSSCASFRLRNSLFPLRFGGQPSNFRYSTSRWRLYFGATWP